MVLLICSWRSKFNGVKGILHDGNQTLFRFVFVFVFVFVSILLPCLYGYVTSGFYSDEILI